MQTKDITDEWVILAYMQSKVEDMRRYPYDILSTWTGAPFKVCYKAMERASKRDYIEYGTSLRTGWPTDKGIQYVQSIRLRD